jgi:plasmid stabilization system protein ParE
VTYRLRVTARADADETHAWITEHGSTDQADRWYQGLFKQMATLTKHPTRCPHAAESDKFPEELRQLLYGKGKNKYRIIFAIGSHRLTSRVHLTCTPRSVGALGERSLKATRPVSVPVFRRYPAAQPESPTCCSESHSFRII